LNLSDENATPKPRSRIAETVVLLLVLPAILSNAVFWGLIFLEPYIRSVIPFTGFLALVPAVGVVYGLVVGNILYSHLGIRNSFFHPVAQAIFQPFWFFVMLAGGCICAIPIVLLSM